MKDLNTLLEVPPQKNRSDQIYEQISALIRNGDLPAGYVFPNEAELCKQLNIGRSTMREAYKALELAGYIFRNKRGTIVNDSSKILECTPLKTIASQATPEDFIEFRVMLELQTATSAAERATKKNINILEECHENLIRAKEHMDLPSMSECDIRFHQEIANATSNPMIIASMAAVSSVWETETEQNFRRALKRDTGLFDRMISQHRDILDAIIARDEKLARKCMINHIYDMSGVNPSA